MKLSKHLSLLFLALLGVIGLQAQESDKKDTKEEAVEASEPKKESNDEASEEASSKLPITYTLGSGLFNYRGDIGQTEDLGTTENFEVGFFGSVEYKIKNLVGIDVNGFYGHVSKNERNEAINRNFRSSLIGVGIGANYHFANGYILSENYPIDPFISVGATFLMFDPYKDSLDASGNTYHYWRDGSVRDIDERDVLAPSAVEIQRDYEYETQYDVSERNSIAFPFTAGFNFKINDYLSAQAKHTVILTMTDYLDGHKAGKANDIVHFTTLGFTFNPAGISSAGKDKKDEFDDIDFASILKSDGDADGVLDIDDWCQETDEGVKVDKHGCPEDADGDGIPDHLDKEKETKDEALKIDSSGVAISDSLVALEAADTIVTLREELCEFYPSMCQGDETDIEFQLLNRGKADKSLLNSKVEASNKPIEEIMKETDLNKDGKIEAKEIYESIDKYFDGEIDLDLGDIHKLIDYFFEQ